MLYYTYSIRLDIGAFLSGWEFSGLGVCKAENKKETPKSHSQDRKMFKKANTNTKMHVTCIVINFIQEK